MCIRASKSAVYDQYCFLQKRIRAIFKQLQHPVGANCFPTTCAVPDSSNIAGRANTTDSVPPASLSFKPSPRKRPTEAIRSKSFRPRKLKSSSCSSARVERTSNSQTVRAPRPDSIEKFTRRPSAGRADRECLINRFYPPGSERACCAKRASGCKAAAPREGHPKLRRAFLAVPYSQN